MWGIIILGSKTHVRMTVDELQKGDVLRVRLGKKTPIAGVTIVDRCNVDESIIAGAAMSVSLLPVVSNAPRLRSMKL